MRNNCRTDSPCAIRFAVNRLEPKIAQAIPNKEDTNGSTIEAITAYRGFSPPRRWRAAATLGVKADGCVGNKSQAAGALRRGSGSAQGYTGMQGGGTSGGTTAGFGRIGPRARIHHNSGYTGHVIAAARARLHGLRRAVREDGF
jgi:hypothetical protein